MAWKPCGMMFFSTSTCEWHECTREYHSSGKHCHGKLYESMIGDSRAKEALTIEEYNQHKEQSRGSIRATLAADMNHRPLPDAEWQHAVKKGTMQGVGPQVHNVERAVDKYVCDGPGEVNSPEAVAARNKENWCGNEVTNMNTKSVLICALHPSHTGAHSNELGSTWTRTIVDDGDYKSFPDTYAGGGERYNAPGKLRYDLFPAKAMEELARVYTNGAVKYSDRNWEDGMSWMRMLAGIMRHSAAWIMGQAIDPDPKIQCHHMACVAWNALCLVEYYFTGKGTDDRPYT